VRTYSTHGCTGAVCSHTRAMSIFFFGRGQINTVLLSDGQKAVMTGNDPVMPMTGRMTVPGVFVGPLEASRAPRKV
jgi:hypothetical protein